MSTFAPLYVETMDGPLQAYLFVHPAAQQMYFAACDAGETAERRREHLIFPVSNLLSQRGIDAIKRAAGLWLGDLSVHSHVVPGEKPTLGSQGEKARLAIQEICDTTSKKPEFLDQVIAAENAAMRLPLEQLWPPHMNAVQAADSLIALMAAEGKRVVGDIPRTLVDKLEDAEALGKALTPAQQDFLHEERKKLAGNPLRQKPKHQAGDQ